MPTSSKPPTFRAAVWARGLVIATMLGACGSSDGDGPTSEEPLPAPATIDEAVERRLEQAGLEPVLAGNRELCRRLYADLLGRFPTADEVQTSCAGIEPETIAAELQQREEYVVVGLRRWRDRLGSSDALLYWRDLMPVFDLVEQLLRQQIDYEQFAIAATGEPGLMALDPDAEGRAYRAHRVFLGTEASAAVASDLARLTRIWDVRLFEVPTFGGVVQEASRAYVVPGHCGELGECATELVPGGHISFPEPGSRPFNGIKYELLTQEQKQSLRGLGEHLVAQPKFWEAAADDVLDRLLGWSDGGSAPRRVGRVMPQVRQLVLEHLRETKSIASAERMVIGSLLYRQSNRRRQDAMLEAQGDTGDDAEEIPIWAYGPLKFTSAEVVLNTMRGSGLRRGTCDPRTADDAIYTMHVLGYFLSLEDENFNPDGEYRKYIEEFHEEQGNWRSLVEQELVHPEDPEQTKIALGLDPTYFEVARLFGGCPGLDSPRLTALDGLAYAFGEEVAANVLCERAEVQAWTSPNANPVGVADALLPRLLSRPPTAQEHDLVSTMACGGQPCETAELTRGLCVAVLGSHEMLFY